jgi:hypothetical protein
MDNNKIEAGIFMTYTNSKHTLISQNIILKEAKRTRKDKGIINSKELRMQHQQTIGAERHLFLGERTRPKSIEVTS